MTLFWVPIIVQDIDAAVLLVREEKISSSTSCCKKTFYNPLLTKNEIEMNNLKSKKYFSTRLNIYKKDNKKVKEEISEGR